jgi:Signal recognition particle GTPase
MFENLTNKFEGILDTFKKAPSLNEKQVDEGLKLIRQALLEADVSLEVLKDFVTKVKPKLLGKEIIRSTAPGQMVV